MKRIDPDVLFIVALCGLAIAMACLLSCGGAQRKCSQADAMGLKGGGAPRCTDEGR